MACLSFRNSRKTRSFARPKAAISAQEVAQHRNEGDDEQLVQVMPGIVRAWIGDVAEGGEEDVHAKYGLREGNPPSRIHHGAGGKGLNLELQTKLRFPWFYGGCGRGCRGVICRRNSAIGTACSGAFEDGLKRAFLSVFSER